MQSNWFCKRCDKYNFDSINNVCQFGCGNEYGREISIIFTGECTNCRSKIIFNKENNFNRNNYEMMNSGEAIFKCFNCNTKFERNNFIEV